MSLNEPTISFQDSDDPDSRAMKKGLGLIFWPGAGLLIVLTITVYVFQALWLAKALLWYSGIWLAAQLMFRPSKFGAELAACLWALRDVFAAATAFLANSGLAAMIARANAGAKAGKQSKPAQAPLTLYNPLAALAETAAAPVAPEPPLHFAVTNEADTGASDGPAPPPPVRRKIDWSGVLRRWWWIAPAILVAFVLVRIASPLLNWINGPSAREVVADVRANQAEAETRTTAAENDQIASALRRVEAAAARLHQLERDAEIARDAIRNAPTLDVGIAEHDAYVDGLRDTSARDRAAALSDLRASIDP